MDIKAYIVEQVRNGVSITDVLEEIADIANEVQNENAEVELKEKAIWDLINHWNGFAETYYKNLVIPEDIDAKKIEEILDSCSSMIQIYDKLGIDL